MRYGDCFICTTIHLLEWLQERGYQPSLTLPVEGKRDKWTYIFKNNPRLEWDANYYFRHKLWKER